MRFLLLGVVLLPALAGAQESARVSASFTGGREELPRLEASVRELLLRLNVSVEPAGTAGVLAHLEVSWSEPTALHLTVKDRAGEVILVRNLSRAGSPQLLAEAAAHVIQSTVEELLDLAREKPKAPPPPPVPVVEVVSPRPPAPPATGLGFGVGAHFGGRLYGGGAPLVVGGGLELTASYTSEHLRPFLSLLGDYHPSFERALDLVALRAQSFSFRVVPGLSVLRGERWRLDAGLGAGADLFFTSTSSSELPAGRLSGARTDAAPVLTALVQFHLAIAERFDLRLAFTVDADLQPPRYVAQLGPMREELFSPWRARPSLTLGFGLDPVGPAPFAGVPEATP